MDNASIAFNTQLKLDVLLNGLSEITEAYVGTFKRHNLTEVIIPEGVTHIRNWAFFDCRELTNIMIPDSVTNIGSYAFAGCAHLTNIMIPDSVTSIGVWAFCACECLTSVTIPDSVKSIGKEAFKNCRGLTSVTFEGKTLNKVKAMKYYPWDISPEKMVYKSS